MVYNEKVIEVQNLTKYYGSKKAIENINFSVNKGEIHGFLGPNGAGKTTTIKILVGLLKQTSGLVSIDGKEAGSIEAKNMIGYIPSDYEFYNHYSVGEYLRYLAKLRGSTPLFDDLVSKFDLDLNRKPKELSKGNRQKINIVQGLMHDPDVIIADEPTSGLDPLMQTIFDEVINNFAKRGKTIFLSSHVLSEVQHICESVTVIKDGKIIKTGSINTLLKSVPRKAILRISNDISLVDFKNNLAVNITNLTNDRIELYFDYPIIEFVKKISEYSTIKDLFIPEPDLEEYFLSLYQK